MFLPPKSNVTVKPNVWCDGNQTDEDVVPYFLEGILPGDLLVEFLGTRDERTIRSKLSPRQQFEYRQSRFFQRHGQEGLAFED